MVEFYGSSSADTLYFGYQSSGWSVYPPGTYGSTNGYDFISAGGGDDYVEAAGGGDEVYGASGDDTLSGSDGNDYVDGGSGDDWLYGDADDDWLYGSSGIDYLFGGSGYDTLDGGSDYDEMYGGEDDDLYYVNSGGAADYIYEYSGEGYDTVAVYSGNHTLGANFEALLLAAFSNQNGTGNSLANYIEGNNYNNQLDGLGGNDEIRGLYGNDTLLGGNGNDNLFGGNDKDLLRGQAGNDYLQGGFQADTMIGGAGNDIFDFDAASGSQPGARDVIRSGDGATAFQGAGGTIGSPGDRIDLSGIDANSNTVVNESFIFGGLGVRHLTLSNSGSNTLIRGNTDGDAAFELEILIEDTVFASAYNANDFYL